MSIKCSKREAVKRFLIINRYVPAVIKAITEVFLRLTVAELRSALLRDYDTFVVDWLLQEFAGLRLVPAGDTYVVEVVEDAP